MIRRLWSEQVRITFWAWIATLGAAAMLAPLTESKRYLAVGAFGALVVATAGAVLRARRIHLLLVLVAELIVGIEWAILMYAQDNAVLGFIPGPDALSDLRDRWSSYADQATQYAAPLPQSPDVTMAMALVLVGLGIVIDIVAVSWRRASLLGLLFLAVYMTPVSILGGEISIVAFLFGALGYVFLLAADERERLTHWGRQISTASSIWDRPSEVDEGGLRRNGTRVGLSAIALAAVLPVLIPTLSPHYFGQTGSGGPGDGDGDGDGVTMGEPILDLRRNLEKQDPSVLLRVATTDPNPKYFRIAALNYFTGNSWEVTDRDPDEAVSSSDTLPPIPGLDPSILTLPYDYDVEVTDEFDSTWLPLVYAPAAIDVKSEWMVDQVHLDALAAGSDSSTAGLSYRFSATKPRPSDVDMEGAGQTPTDLMEYTDLPNTLPPEFERVTRRVTAGTQTKFEAAQAIEDWFNDGIEFEYDITAEDISSQGIEDLTAFLTEDRVGYCEQFASAMAIMARTLRIPSRVAVGFLEPDHIEGNRWQFTGADMHAWPELYFDGAGWVRFEPTPQSEFTEGAEPLEFSGVDPSVSTDTPSQPTDPASTPTPNNPERSPAETVDSGDNDDAGGGIGRWWLAGAIPLGVAVLASLPRIARAQVRRRRWSRAVDPVTTAETAWAELRAHVVDLRMEWDAGATPRATGRSLRERLPDDRQAGGPVVAGLNRLVLAIEQARYARAIRQPEGLREAVESVTDALSSRQTGRQRFLARWLPASLLRTGGRRTRVRPERLGELLVSVED